MTVLKDNDSQNEIRAVPPLFPKEEPQDWAAPQSGDVQDARSRGKARARSAILQARALAIGNQRLRASDLHQCGRAHIARKSSTARMIAAMLLARTVR